MEDKMEDILLEPKLVDSISSIVDASKMDDQVFAQPDRPGIDAEEEEFELSKFSTADDTSLQKSLKDINDDILFHLSEGTIKPWKQISDISAKVLHFDKDFVIIECLMDKENQTYDEREFSIQFFTGINLEKGMLLKLCYFQRDNQIMMEIKFSPGLVLESDFPKSNFAEKYKDLVFKKNR
jgi:hypothetical protein